MQLKLKLWTRLPKRVKYEFAVETWDRSPVKHTWKLIEIPISAKYKNRIIKWGNRIITRGQHPHEIKRREYHKGFRRHKERHEKPQRR